MGGESQIASFLSSLSFSSLVVSAGVDAIAVKRSGLVW
jgi:hypothetical protein